MSPQIFTFETHSVRTIIGADGQPWFVAADVCRVLELDQVSAALRRLDDDESTLISITGASNSLPINAVNEAGLYSLILGSRKPEAKAFKRWVTHEVLPAIRKTGQYSAAPALPALPQNYKEAVRALLVEIEAKEALEAQAKVNAPKVEFYHQVAAAKDDFGMKETAKLLGMGRNRMMKELRRMEVLMSNNTPFQRFIDSKLFRVAVIPRTDGKGTAHADLVTRVLPRGVEYIRRRFGIPQPAAILPFVAA